MRYYMLMMAFIHKRITVLLLCLPMGVVLAQQNPAPAGVSAPPKNLKILPPTDLMDVMQAFNISLGVQCTYCHVRGDFASDDNEHKLTARAMIQLVRDIEPFFPYGGTGYPRGYHEVDCETCHRGSAIPETKSPTYFINKREAMNPPTDNDPGVNLKALPMGTRVHGSHSIMEDFRDALQVDCAYCHGGAGGFPADNNPRKEISRSMIKMTAMINSKFPGTGAYPEGKQVVTCYSCHRGGPHPASLSNKRYEGPIPPAN